MDTEERKRIALEKSTSLESLISTLTAAISIWTRLRPSSTWWKSIPGKCTAKSAILF